MLEKITVLLIVIGLSTSKFADRSGIITQATDNRLGHLVDDHHPFGLGDAAFGGIGGFRGPFCPNNCSGHGKCDFGICKCDAGYEEQDCK
jgi:hypothetical protein